MKNIAIGLSFCLNLVMGILFYIETNKDGPVDIGISFKDAVRSESYDLARTLMAAGRVEHISDESLKKANEIMSAGTSFNTYELLEFDNGKMVLLHLTPDKKYEIQNVVIVPEELKFLFT